MITATSLTPATRTATPLAAAPSVGGFVLSLADLLAPAAGGVAFGDEAAADEGHEDAGLGKDLPDDRDNTDPLLAWLPGAPPIAEPRPLAFTPPVTAPVALAATPDRTVTALDDATLTALSNLAPPPTDRPATAAPRDLASPASTAMTGG